MAETLTDKIKLSKRDTGDLNWGQGANANLDAIDAHAQQAILRPPRTLLATLGSGAVGANLLGSTSYFYKVTAVNAAGETTEGKIPATLEAQVTQPATPLPVILQWETVKGATGYKIYKSSASGQEKFLASVSGEATSVYTDDGNTAVNGAISVPAANTARTSVSKIVAGANVTINPPDGTGDVTINAAGGTSADASDTVKGITKLSVAPALATNPISVGDNDPRNADSRTPTGVAGGDLGGTYPNPSVAKVNGTSVPASPSTGQVLTATGPTAAAWQAPAGGGGYATVVVAAPTGIGITDRTNIQNAINSLPASGGMVVLREGNYVLDNGITFPAAKPVTLLGQGLSTVISLTTAFNDTFPPAIIGGPGAGDMSKITLADFQFAGIGRKASFIRFTAGAGQMSSDITIRNLLILAANEGIVISAAGVGAKMQNVTIADCHFVDPSASIITGQSSGGTTSGITISGTHTRKASGISGFAMFIEGARISFVNNFIEDQGFGGGLNLSGVGLSDSVIDGNTIIAFICINIPSGATNFIRTSVISNNDFIVTGGGTLAMRTTGELSNSVVVGNRASHPIQLDANAASSGNVIVANKATITDNSGQSNVVAQNFVIGLRKLGEASALTGDVKLEAGSGIALTQDTPNNKITIAAASGGYTTVVAPAPTGVEATDTPNLQAALDAVDTLKGGEVILREGTYLCGQLIIRRNGLKLRGLNGNTLGNSPSAAGSKIRFNVSTQDGLLVQANHVTIEGVAFQMTNVSGGFACILAGANFTSGGRSLVVKNCSFVEIRQSSVALRVSGLERLVVDECMFEFNNPFGNSASYTAIGVKLEGGAVPTINGVISNCVFWDKNANPPSGGAVITVKFIVLDGGGERYKISGCHGRGFAGGSASEPSTFIEIRDVGNWACSDNRFDQLNRFIKDISTGIPANVTVTGNICYQSSAPSPEGLIDLVAARSWSIVGNVISSGVKSVRLQIGTALVIVLGNALGSPVDNTGSGNVVVNNT